LESSRAEAGRTCGAGLLFEALRRLRTPVCDQKIHHQAVERVLGDGEGCVRASGAAEQQSAHRLRLHGAAAPRPLLLRERWLRWLARRGSGPGKEGANVHLTTALMFTWLKEGAWLVAGDEKAH
jgi:hypothetical protein